MLNTIKIYACYAFKIYKKTKPNKFLNWVARARYAGPESAFVKLEIILFYFLFSMHDIWLAKGTLQNHK